MNSEIEKRQVLKISLICTFLSLVPTAYVALISNSLTLLADLLRCLVEFIAIAITWVVSLKTTAKNAQFYHYGFSKLEHLASLAVGSAMIIVFAVALTSSVFRFFAPQSVHDVMLGLIFALLSVAGNMFIFYKNWRLSKVISSPVCESQARLFLSKAMASSVVVISLCFAQLESFIPWSVYADPIGSLLIAFFLLYSGYQLSFKSLGEILDIALEESAQMLIMKTLVKFEGSYKTINRIRTRRAGNTNHIELWLSFEGQRSIREVQASVDHIKKELEASVDDAEVVIVATAHAG